ncbi:regenerating islet-derived protein 3-gamma [Octodon degus]|uniref:Regenerating islet-derived protein 3-gamma n=1 Tax=Octodon degus TaxID=10160 RepID=A0A6P3FC87_OCTDE|nr:regenerating islet-derived protein 3-gamma [Octodon degus]
MLPASSLKGVSWVLFSSLLLLCQVQGEGAREKLSSPRVSCPQGSRAYGSYCYALFKTPKSWTFAELACQKRPSGHLASVLSEAEAAFMSSLVRISGTSYPYIWIGLHDSTLGLEPNAGGWVWSSTDVLDFFNWDRNPSTASDRGYCGSVTQTSGFLKWRDYDCDAELPYICKFKP